MAKIFVTRRIPKAGMDLLTASGHQISIWDKDAIIPRKDLLKKAKGADAILTLLTEKVDAELLDAVGPQLKVVANLAVGYDNLDLPLLASRGIKAANTPGVLTEAVAEHAFALMMAVVRRIPESERYLRAGKYMGWGPLLFLGPQLEGKTFGIIGLGRIGVSVARKAAKGMGMKVMYNDMQRNEEFEKEFNAGYATVDGILKNADVVSIHVPLLPTTRHLIDEKRLAMMKPTAYLINTSRGPIVDEKALVTALKKKKLAGAGLDVFEFEPKLTPGLAKLENVVITPHTASSTLEARDAMARLAAQAILDVLAGKTPKNLVASR